MHNHTRHILVTRPNSDGARALCEAIHQAGFIPIHYPTLDFENLPVCAETYSKEAFDIIIFNSPQAVKACREAFDWNGNGNGNGLKAKHVAAIGEGTARAIEKELAITISFIPPPNSWHARGLLALPSLQPARVKGKKIAIIRGEGGREILEETLSARGAAITSIILYKRILPATDFTAIDFRVTSHHIAAIICTSFESVNNLKILAGHQLFPHLSNIPLIVISQRIKTLAHNLGFRTIWVATNPSTKAIMTTLIQRLKYKDESHDGRIH